MKIKSKVVAIYAIIIVCVVSILIYISLMYYTKHNIINWAGNSSREFNEMYKPTNMLELTATMKGLQPKTPIIIIGGNHSWSPSKYYWGTNTESLTGTPVCLNLIDFKGQLSYDESSSVVTCLAGTPLGELLHFLAKHKRSLATYPNSPFISVGGMVATCSHGAALAVGSVSELVIDMQYILPGDDKPRSVPDELLGAYAASLGQLGVVCTVSLQTIPISWFKRDITNVKRGEFIQNMKNSIKRSELLRVFWTPETDMCEVQEYIRLPNTTNDVISLYPCKIDNHFMVYQSQDLVTDINYAPELDTQFGLSNPPLSLKNVTGYGHCQKQLECPQNVPTLLEAEYAVSIEHLKDALDVIKSWIDKYNPIRIGTIYIRFCGGDSLPWISPVKGSGPFAWIIVDIDYTHMPDHFSMFTILQNELWSKVRARPHMGKWNNTDPKRFVEMYGDDGVKFLELAKNI